MGLLEIEDLNKAFGSLMVTRNVSLSVPSGRKHVIIGPNGAGKTSLIHQIGGQLQPDSGRILIDGAEVGKLGPEGRARLGLARTFQKNTLFPKLSVHENVRLGAQARFGSPFDLFRPARRSTELDDRAASLLARFGLDHLARAPAGSISYGDQRQLELAVALSGEPRILLLDEPTSGLSPTETKALVGVIRSLPDDLAILMIEHDMEVVFSLADRITVLYYGEVLAEGTPEEVTANARVQEVYLGAGI